MSCFATGCHREGVIKPAREIRSNPAQAGRDPLSDEQIRRVLGLLIQIMETKRVNHAEQPDRSLEVLGRASLHESFGRLLEHAQPGS